MNAVEILNIVWLVSAILGMGVLAYTMYQQHRRSKAFDAQFRREHAESHAEFMEYMKTQKERLKREGKEPWEQ